MDMIPTEAVLLKSDSGQLTLTSHRVRYHSEALGAANVISIMLEEVASCGVVHSSSPILLILAAVCGLLIVGGPSETRLLLLLVGAILVAAYFATRKHVLAIASAGHQIKVAIQGMSTKQVMDFVETTELAKSRRFDLIRTAVPPTPSYTPAGSSSGSRA